MFLQFHEEEAQCSRKLAGLPENKNQVLFERAPSGKKHWLQVKNWEEAGSSGCRCFIRSYQFIVRKEKRPIWGGAHKVWCPTIMNCAQVRADLIKV